MSPKLHAAAGGLGLILIAGFWSSTLVVELFGGPGAIATVNQAILYGLVLLIPVLALAGASGARLGRGWKAPSVKRKQRRMAFAAANGLLILVPSAIILAARAGAGQFDTAFYMVQGAELLAGTANIVLLSLNMRDGFRLRADRT